MHNISIWDLCMCGHLRCFMDFLFDQTVNYVQQVPIFFRTRDFDPGKNKKHFSLSIVPYVIFSDRTVSGIRKK